MVYVQPYESDDEQKNIVVEAYDDDHQYVLSRHDFYLYTVCYICIAHVSYETGMGYCRCSEMSTRMPTCIFYNISCLYGSRSK